jgi:hypothetical protein
MAKQTNDPKLPVIIALVFFILATLGLGIFAYTLSQDKLKSAEEATKEKSEADGARKAQKTATEELLLYKAMMGDLSNDEKTLITGLSDPAFREKQTKLITTINNRISAAKKAEQDKAPLGGNGLDLTGTSFYNWDWPANQANPTPPKESLIDAMVRNAAQAALAKRKSDIELQGMEASKKSLEAVTDALNKAKAEFDKNNNQYSQDVKTEVNKAIAAFDGFKKDFQNASKDYRTNTEKLNNEIVQRNTEIKRTEQDLALAQNANTRLADQLEVGIDPFQYDKPQGKVLRRYSDNLLDIDIGSADNLRTGQTFSIFPSDTPTRGMQPRMRKILDADGKVYTRPVPKATIEVVDVIGANLSQCRITQEDSPVRDRVLAGDLLYNSIWRKGTSEHIVLYGIFDLDGDGRDDIENLVKSLTRVGVSVDGYYDLKTLKWVGEITSQTTFAVEGYFPTISLADANQEGKIKLLGALADAKKLVKDKGVRVIRPRDFFPRIGLNTKLDIQQEAINSAASFYLRLTGTELGAPAAPPAEGTAAPPAK